jgi:DNA repair ATPase RecN
MIKKESDEDGKILVNLLKKSEIFTKKDGTPLWRIKLTEKPEHIPFVDSKIDNFIGYSFVNKETNEIFLNPPNELLNYLRKLKKRLVKNGDRVTEYETTYGPNIFYGFYKIGAIKKASIEQLEEEIEDGDEIELNHSDMRSWTYRKVAEFVIESEERDMILACIAAQSQYISYNDSNYISELADVFESFIPQVTTKSIKKATAPVIEEEEEEELPVKKLDERFAKLNLDIKKYEKAIKNPKYDEDKIAKYKKSLNKLNKELEEFST